MDEKFQQILKIKPLQETVAAYRNSTADYYRKIVKRTCMAELKNLVNVEMTVEQVEPKLPSKELIPAIPSAAELSRTKVDSLLKECQFVEEGMRLLK
ncbi:uncharacterized protein LOC106095797 [Stomoxys calcitrans]|uniref:Uncharacterized protein n=1 Tax=Stomoxys calcitrans TaxID=35570 RepID=A0A1I8PN37_STOCA|nr:uncharacterized protein LOC106095797 [Stomoxys calcitrans]